MTSRLCSLLQRAGFLSTKANLFHLTEVMTSSSQDVQTGNVEEVLSWKRCNSASTAADGYDSERVHRRAVVPLRVTQEEPQLANLNRETLTCYKPSVLQGALTELPACTATTQRLVAQLKTHI